MQVPRWELVKSGRARGKHRRAGSPPRQPDIPASAYRTVDPPSSFFLPSPQPSFVSPVANSVSAICRTVADLRPPRSFLSQRTVARLRRCSRERYRPSERITLYSPIRRCSRCHPCARWESPAVCDSFAITYKRTYGRSRISPKTKG